MSCKVLFIYPNQRAESLVPPSLAMFSNLLKAEGHQVDLFDSSNYDLDADEYINFPPGIIESFDPYLSKVLCIIEITAVVSDFNIYPAAPPY